MAVKDWSTTPSENGIADAASGILLSEGMLAPTMNDSVRALMAVLKADFANSLTSNGYQKIPNGLIIQWMRGTGGSGGLNLSWPIPFPSACLHVQATVEASLSGTAQVTVAAYSTSGVSLVRTFDAGGSTALANWGGTVLVFGIGH